MDMDVLGFRFADGEFVAADSNFNGISQGGDFADENLRLVQFWMIESELEQAIGRARLLRHDCTVHLFSNFPLKQAEMITGFNYDCQ